MAWYGVLGGGTKDRRQHLQHTGTHEQVGDIRGTVKSTLGLAGVTVEEFPEPLRYRLAVPVTVPFLRYLYLGRQAPSEGARGPVGCDEQGRGGLNRTLPTKAYVGRPSLGSGASPRYAGYCLPLGTTVGPASCPQPNQPWRG